MTYDKWIWRSYPDVFYNMDTPPLDSIVDRLEERTERKERQERQMVLRAKELASIIGHSEASARYHLARYGKKVGRGRYDFPDDMLKKMPRRSGSKLSEAEIEKIHKLEEKGMMRWQIAAIIGRNQATVAKYAVGVPNNRRVPDETIRKIKEMRADGCTYREIARETGYNRNTVIKYAREVHKDADEC